MGVGKGPIRINHKAGPDIFQNIGQGRGNGITALWYFNQVLPLHIVPYFGHHQHHMFQQGNARTQVLSPAAQHPNHAMACSQSGFESNRSLVGRNPKKTQWSATKADNWIWAAFSNGLYQPPYSHHVQEMRVSGHCSWGTYEALTRNASADAWNAICISGNCEEILSSLWWRCVQKINFLRWKQT